MFSSKGLEKGRWFHLYQNTMQLWYLFFFFSFFLFFLFSIFLTLLKYILFSILFIYVYHNCWALVVIDALESFIASLPLYPCPWDIVRRRYLFFFLVIKKDTVLFNSFYFSFSFFYVSLFSINWIDEIWCNFV